MSRLAVVTLLAGLGGCASGLHSTAPQEQVYYLRGTPVTAPGLAPDVAATRAVDAVTDGHSAMRASIHVTRPLAGPGLDSSHIVLLESSHRMSFYTASRWPASLPEVVETLAMQALSGSGAWISVQGADSPFSSDYLLQIRIRRFEADYSGGAVVPAVHVVLDCTLGRRTGRQIVRTFVAESTAPAAANKLGEVVAAFESAAAQAVTSMAASAATAVRADSPQNVDSPVPSMKR